MRDSKAWTSAAIELGLEVPLAGGAALGDLQAHPWLPQICLRQPHEGGAEFNQPAHHPRGVLVARLDPHVQILSCSWPAVYANRVGTHDEEAGISGRECA
ncbi:MAG TPA: hypothetical protein VFQ61_12240 [Polyangiaceae bacterium]|nr:hypothetical protein [Polyangiaceae bacterium]